MTPTEIFQNHYKGLVNPMTPVLLEYGWITEGLSAYELSTNPKGTMFGVTVLTDDEWNVEMSGAFDTIVEARVHISMLKTRHGNAKVYVQ